MRGVSPQGTLCLTPRGCTEARAGSGWQERRVRGRNSPPSFSHVHRISGLRDESSVWLFRRSCFSSCRITLWNTSADHRTYPGIHTFTRSIHKLARSSSRFWPFCEWFGWNDEQLHIYLYYCNITGFRV